MIGNLQFSNIGLCKAIGCFCGQAIGDSLGYHLEGQPFDNKRDFLKSFNELGIKQRQPVGQWSDDTAQALCIADSLLENKKQFNGLDIIHRFFLWYHSGYNNGKKYNEQNLRYSIGVGRSALKSMEQFINYKKYEVEKEKEYKQQNNRNGSIMRICPIPIAFHLDINKGMEYAYKQSFITHSGEEAADGCRLLTYIIIKCLESKEKTFEALKQILDEVPLGFKSENPAIHALTNSIQETKFTLYEGSSDNESINDRNWNWKDPNFQYSLTRQTKYKNIIGLYSTDCIAMSLHILYYIQGYKQALLKAINLGGDADSIGSIVGSIAGAAYGFNEEIKLFYKTVQKWDENLIAARAFELYNLK